MHVYGGTNMQQALLDAEWIPGGWSKPVSVLYCVTKAKVGHRNTKKIRMETVMSGGQRWWGVDLDLTHEGWEEPFLGKARKNGICRNPESEEDLASMFKGSPSSSVNAEQRHMGWSWKGRQGPCGLWYMGKIQFKLKGKMPNHLKQEKGPGNYFKRWLWLLYMEWIRGSKNVTKSMVRKLANSLGERWWWWNKCIILIWDAYMQTYNNIKLKRVGLWEREIKLSRQLTGGSLSG